MILIVLVGPNLISQDLRFNALPLYFSRPLRRIDYFLGKLGVIAAILGMVIIVPSIIRLRSWPAVQSRHHDHPRHLSDSAVPAFAYGLVIVVSAGTLILALSSLIAQFALCRPLLDRHVDRRRTGRRLAGMPRCRSTSEQRIHAGAGTRAATIRIAAAIGLEIGARRQRKPTGGRLSRTPQTSRASAKNCWAPTPAGNGSRQLRPGESERQFSSTAPCRDRNIPGIGRPACWPVCLDFPHAF